MNKCYTIILITILFLPIKLFAQVNISGQLKDLTNKPMDMVEVLLLNKDSITVKVDSLYREDQFYAGITYNALQNTPEGVSQKKFTPSFSFGILRDMPINKSRNIAFALGLGYSINNYNENLLITQNAGKRNYATIEPDIDYDKNKLILHYVDFPVEFRWRTSTPQSHKFYRIYTGFKASYLVYDYSKFEDRVIQ